jgi:hypothetical protein
LSTFYITLDTFNFTVVENNFCLLKKSYNIYYEGHKILASKNTFLKNLFLHVGKTANFTQEYVHQLKTRFLVEIIKRRG